MQFPLTFCLVFYNDVVDPEVDEDAYLRRINPRAAASFSTLLMGYVKPLQDAKDPTTPSSQSYYVHPFGDTSVVKRCLRQRFMLPRDASLNPPVSQFTLSC